MTSSLSLISLPSFASSLKSISQKQVRRTSVSCTSNCEAKSFFLNPSDERILKKAFKEPVAFMGGMFAGILRLDLNEDPLKEWVTKTVEASGIITDEEELEDQNVTSQPQQIQID
ncbi:hypothetical protein SSX86_022658 [Deinandra increscens subsp. villosa]|uniref:Uncharacterized protein n=1 Tax=Deinandra increscens subsp. villosa TaxID=3103831 RepID=A0AAP0CJF8_9ASTR